MMWQDLIFLAGNVFSIAVLGPTLKDPMANVPLGTSLPSVVIGLVYGTTFFTMGMTFSALGALLTGLIWGLIAAFRSPGDVSLPFTGDDEVANRASRSAVPHAD